jgi:hypothetical protein
MDINVLRYTEHSRFAVRRGWSYGVSPCIGALCFHLTMELRTHEPVTRRLKDKSLLKVGADS